MEFVLNDVRSAIVGRWLHFKLVDENFVNTSHVTRYPHFQSVHNKPGQPCIFLLKVDGRM